jgi:hypothetical protein
LNQNIDADKICVVVARFVVGGCVVLRLGGLFVVKQKCIRKKEKWGEWRGGSSGHKLNIIDRIIS